MVLKAKGEKWYGKYVAEKLPDLSDKIVAITGTTQGTGFWAAVATVRKNAKKLYLLNRDSERATSSFEKLQKEKEEVNSETVIVPIICDLSSFKSVKDAVAKFHEENEDEGKLDVILNNAGILGDTAVTEEGFYRVAQVNLLSPYLLVALLLEDLKKSTGARVVYVTSSFRFQYTFSKKDFEKADPEKAKKMKKKEGERLYSSTKVASGLLTFQMNKQLKGSNVIAVTADPGVCKTVMLKDHLNPVTYAMVPSQSPADGSLPLIEAAFGKDVYAGDLIVPKGFLNIRGRPRKAIENGKSQWKFFKEKKMLDSKGAQQLWDMCEAVGEAENVPKVEA